MESMLSTRTTRSRAVEEVLAALRPEMGGGRGVTERGGAMGGGLSVALGLMAEVPRQGGGGLTSSRPLQPF